MRIGIGSYTFSWAIGIQKVHVPPVPLTPFDLLDRAAELGVDVVQIADNLPLDTLSQAELSRLRAAAETRGLVLEAGTRGDEPERLLRYLDIAARLQSNLLRTLPGPDLAESERSLRAVLPRFEALGVAIALENYERHTSRELAALVERIASPFVGVCLDTVNSFGALEGLEEVSTILAPHTINLHIKDFDIERLPSMLGFQVTGRPAGEGRLNVDRLLEKLAPHGKDPSLILELWTPFTGSPEETIALEAEWALRSVRYLKRYR